MGFIKDLKAYRASLGKSQLAPKVRKAEKVAKQRKQLRKKK